MKLHHLKLIIPIITLVMFITSLYGLLTGTIPDDKRFILLVVAWAMLVGSWLIPKEK